MLLSHIKHQRQTALGGGIPSIEHIVDLVVDSCRSAVIP